MHSLAKEMADSVKGYVEKQAELIREELASCIAALPSPEKGEKGDSGSDGADGKDGVPPSPEDVAKAMEGIFHKWALDFERKADLVLEKAIAKIPAPINGKDGKDALSVDDFDLTIEDDRKVTVSLKCGDRVVEKSVIIPSIIDKGVFGDGLTYEKGDAVSYGGQLYIAQKDAPEGKPSTTNDWRLAVKRGRDGRESIKVERQIESVKI